MTERFGSTNDVFGTGDVFLDLFAYGNQNLSENKEAIWVAQFAANLSDGGGKNNGPRRHGPRYYSLGNDPAGYTCILGELIDGKYTGYTDTLSRPVSWSRPTYYVTNKFGNRIGTMIFGMLLITSNEPTISKIRNPLITDKQSISVCGAVMKRMVVIR